MVDVAERQIMTWRDTGRAGFGDEPVVEGLAKRLCPAPGRVTCFQNPDVMPRPDQLVCGDQPGKTGAHHDHVYPVFRWRRRLGWRLGRRLCRVTVVRTHDLVRAAGAQE